MAGFSHISMVFLPSRIPSKALVIYPDFDIGLGDAHAGLYCAQPELTPDWEQGAFLYNDNFKVIRYPVRIVQHWFSHNAKPARFAVMGGGSRFVGLVLGRGPRLVAPDVLRR